MELFNLISSMFGAIIKLPYAYLFQLSIGMPFTPNVMVIQTNSRTLLQKHDSAILGECGSN